MSFIYKLCTLSVNQEVDIVLRMVYSYFLRFIAGKNPNPNLNPIPNPIPNPNPNDDERK